MRPESELLLNNLVTNVLNYFDATTFDATQLADLQSILEQIKQTHTPVFFFSFLSNSAFVTGKIDALKNSLTVDGKDCLRKVLSFIDSEARGVDSVANELVAKLAFNNEEKRLNANLFLIQGNSRNFITSLRLTAIRTGAINISFGSFDQGVSAKAVEEVAAVPASTAVPIAELTESQAAPIAPIRKFRFGSFSDSEDGAESGYHESHGSVDDDEDEDSKTEFASDDGGNDSDDLDRLIRRADKARSRLFLNAFVRITTSARDGFKALLAGLKELDVDEIDLDAEFDASSEHVETDSRAAASESLRMG